MADWGTREASARREEGLKKKAAELATLCGVDICILGCGRNDELFLWADDVRGGGGATVGKERKKAEEGVVDISSGSFRGSKEKRVRESNMAASLGADGLVEAEEVAGDDKGGGGASVVRLVVPLLSSPVAAAPWMDPDDDFDLLEALNVMCSDLPMVMRDDLLEPLQMADGGGPFPVLPMDPLPSSAAAATPSFILASVEMETTCESEALWGAEDGAFPPYSAALDPLDVLLAGRVFGCWDGLQEPYTSSPSCGAESLCDVDICLLGCSPGIELFFQLDDDPELQLVAELYLAAMGGGGGATVGRKRKKAEAGVGDLCSGSFPGWKKRQKREFDMVGSLGGQEVEDEVVASHDDGGDEDFELMEALCMMCSPSPVTTPGDLLEPLQMDYSSGPPPPSAAADLSSIFAGVDLETTMCDAEPL